MADNNAHWSWQNQQYYHDKLIQEINEKIADAEMGDGSLIAVDTTLSTTSTNAVQNKVITEELNKKLEVTDVSKVATSNDYNDLDNKPTSLPASDVSDWAKSPMKPTYTASEVGLGNVENKSSATIRNEITSKNVTDALGYTPAELGDDGKVLSSMLPSYVDDVLEYAAKANFPTTGETGKIYIDKTSNKTYRWSGSAYVEISASLALGETSSTAYRGDRGKVAYDHSQTAHAPSNAEANVQSDWDVTDTTSDAFIKNKPTALPADGGNADTVDGYHANALINHKNLIINSDFCNPVNTKGATSYSGLTEYIDCWEGHDADSVVELTADGLYFAKNDTVASTVFKQALPVYLAGKSIYCSTEFVNVSGTVDIRIFYLNSEGATRYQTISTTTDGVKKGKITIPEGATDIYASVGVAEASSSATIKWIKYELGDTHTDYITPTYEEEWLRVQARKSDVGGINADTVDNLHANEIINHYNLCVNSNFLDPVNTEGLTTLEGKGYIIDKWYSYYDTCNAELRDNGLYITRSETGIILGQTFPNDRSYAGKTLAVSAKITEITGTIAIRLRWVLPDAPSNIITSGVNVSKTGTFYTYATIPENAYSVGVVFRAQTAGASAVIEGCVCKFGTNKPEYILPDKSYTTERLTELNQTIDADTVEGYTINEFVSNPNLIINPDLKINQKGEDEYAGTGKYGADRWIVGTAGKLAYVDGQPVLSKLNDDDTAAAILMRQDIMPKEKGAMSGKTITVSVDVEASAAETFRLRVWAYNTTGATTLRNKTVEIPAGQGVYTYTTTLPEDAEWLRVAFATKDGGLAQETLKINYVKLEVGAVATQYTPPRYAEELLKIQAIDGTITAEVEASLGSHTSNTNNPHSVTKSQVGLGNVENKSSATIRSEITSENVTDALGYTPAELGDDGKILSSMLPSYVDDVIEATAKANFPTTGETGKIYIDTSTNKTYRWSGSAYAEISASLALGTTSSTAYRGDRGKIAYDHSQTAHAPSNAEANVQSDWSVTDTSSDAYIKNKPSSLPANGGNATTVNNHTVNTDVPADAKFTDTTYSVMTAATSSAAGESGLVPAPDAGAQAKFLRGDGTWQTPTNTTYTNAKLGQGYGTCSTAAATVAKVVTLSNYTLASGGIVSVKFTNAVPANATMNINSKGAKAIYYHGAAITDGVIKAGDIGVFMYSTQYHLLTIDRDEVGAITEVGTTATETFTINDTEYTEEFTADSNAETFNANNVALGKGSHAEGLNTKAYGYASHAEGEYTIARGRCSHAEGRYTFTYETGSHAEGYYTKAISSNSHAEGDHSEASGTGSHAEGYYTKTTGAYSHTSGNHTTASNHASYAIGKHNKAMAKGGDVTNQVGDVLVIGNGTATDALSNAFRVTYTGSTYGLTAFNSSGADYAEFVKPWWDNNPDNEDRVGFMVTVKDGMLYKANEGDYIIGITSGNPSIVGNADEDYYWRYERDEFNRIIFEDVEEEIPLLDDNGNYVTDENGNPVMVKTGNIIKNGAMKLSADYVPALQNDYVERKDRPEWSYVGMIGVLPVRDDGTCNVGGYCKCGTDGIATHSDTRGFDTFFVVERKTENVIVVEMR